MLETEITVHPCSCHAFLVVLLLTVSWESANLAGSLGDALGQGTHWVLLSLPLESIFRESSELYREFSEFLLLFDFFASPYED